eukprot:UN19405
MDENFYDVFIFKTTKNKTFQRPKKQVYTVLIVFQESFIVRAVILRKIF